MPVERTGPAVAGTAAVNEAQAVRQTDELPIQQRRPKVPYPASTASAPVTASALSVTVFSSDGACTEMFSAKKRARAT